MTTPSEAHYSLILRCAGNTLALPLAQVVEVVLVVAPAAPLLRAPRYCLGAVDYHGQLVPLIDLAARLGLRAPRTVLDLPEGRIVMLQGRVGLVGYLVEEVLQRQPAEVRRFLLETAILDELTGAAVGHGVGDHQGAFPTFGAVLPRDAAVVELPPRQVPFESFADLTVGIAGFRFVHGGLHGDRFGVRRV
mgnify:CR=1 FL=1